MLHFWKKTGQKEKGRSKSISPIKSNYPPVSPTLSNGDLKVASIECFEISQSGPLSGFSEDELSLGDLGDFNWSLPEQSKGVSHSRLSKTLAEVLADKNALGYFIQYLEARDCIALIKFWLDVESFHAASSVQIRYDGDHTTCVAITREQLEGPCGNSLLEIDKTSIGTDCGSCSCESISTHETLLECQSIIEQTKKETNLSVEVDIKPASFPTTPIFAEGCDCRIVGLSKIHGSFCDISSNQSVELSGSAVCDNASDIKIKTEVQKFEGRINTLPNEHSSSKIGNLSKEICSRSHNQNTCYSVTNSENKIDEKLDSQTNNLLSPSRAVKLIQSTLHDAVRIFRKYFVHNAPYRIRIPEDLRNHMVASICKVDGMVDSECFSECQTLVFQVLEKDHFNNFLWSDFHCKHQIDVLTSGNVLLSDILYNETALFYFMEFLEQEGNQSLVEFWLAAVNFHQHLLDKIDSYNAMEAQDDAIVLYDKYFSLQATCPLGFGDSIRLEMEQNICHEDGPQLDCFKKPINIVLHVLEKNYLQPFMSSQLFYKYLSELINTIQANPSTISHSKKSGSECSSELSISIQNTLLAMEDSSGPPRKVIRNVDDQEMSIDLRQLYDPDLLWRRRHQSGLSFGKINEMGRYVTDVAPEPDRKEESRISKVVKKLVNLETDKAKEEMAWQIAEMIVKDITNLTMGSNEVHS